MYRKRCVIYREGGFVFEEDKPTSEVFGKGKCLF
jgi:hypothetical protein